MLNNTPTIIEEPYRAEIKGTEDALSMIEILTRSGYNTLVRCNYDECMALHGYPIYMIDFIHAEFSDLRFTTTLK